MNHSGEKLAGCDHARLRTTCVVPSHHGVRERELLLPGTGVAATQSLPSPAVVAFTVHIGRSIPAAELQATQRSERVVL
jgi:hypothetical protein